MHIVSASNLPTLVFELLVLRVRFQLNRAEAEQQIHSVDAAKRNKKVKALHCAQPLTSSDLEDRKMGEFDGCSYDVAFLRIRKAKFVVSGRNQH